MPTTDNIVTESNVLPSPEVSHEEVPDHATAELVNTKDDNNSNNNNSDKYNSSTQHKKEQAESLSEPQESQAQAQTQQLSRPSTCLHIDHILQRKSLGYYFYRFMKEQMDDEVLDFLFAVETFEKCQQEEAKVIAQQIIQIYILPNAVKELNFSGSARASFMKDLGQNNNSITLLQCQIADFDMRNRKQMFKKLSTKVKVQLQEEKVPAFVKSPHYESYLNMKKSRRRSIIKSRRLSFLLKDDSNNYMFVTAHQETVTYIKDKESLLQKNGHHYNHHNHHPQTKKERSNSCSNSSSKSHQQGGWLSKLSAFFGKNKKSKSQDQHQNSDEESWKRTSTDLTVSHYDRASKRLNRLSIRFCDKKDKMYVVTRRTTN